jgi:SPP1 gp7 family putative phage head morphogenesis protein
MLPPTQLARILAARRQKARRKPPRPTLPNQAERIYLGALRRYSDRLEQLTREAILASDWAPVLRTDARAPGPMGFVSRSSRMLDGVRVQLSQESRRLPYDDTAAAVTRHAKGQAQRVIGIKPEQFTTGHSVDGWRERNVRLVTQMTDEQLDRIAQTLDKFDGLNPFDLADELQKEFDFTRARSELIARDQVLKLNGDLTAEAHRQAGIEEYTWSTSKDQSVRDRHADLEGTRQRWDDPPVMNDQGETGHPGDDYECRCVPIPYLPELDESR